MAPFWIGIAIGTGIGVPILIVCCLITGVLAAIVGIHRGLSSGAFTQAWRDGQKRGSVIRTHAEVTRQRQLAWMDAHFGFRTVARLNRRICG